jgi:hypothetical protein
MPTSLGGRAEPCWFKVCGITADAEIRLLIAVDIRRAWDTARRHALQEEQHALPR